MCHNGDHSSGCGEERAGRETQRAREREMDVWQIEERIKRSTAIMMRCLTGWMVFIQFVGISVNTVLTHILR